MDENLIYTIEDRMTNLKTKLTLQKEKTKVELMMLELIENKLNKIEDCKKQIQKTKGGKWNGRKRSNLRRNC